MKYRLIIIYFFLSICLGLGAQVIDSSKVPKSAKNKLLLLHPDSKYKQVLWDSGGAYPRVIKAKFEVFYDDSIGNSHFLGFDSNWSYLGTVSDLTAKYSIDHLPKQISDYVQKHYDERFWIDWASENLDAMGKVRYINVTISRQHWNHYYEMRFDSNWNLTSKPQKKNLRRIDGD